MVRLTEVQRGQAIALLMQGQRQQQVARHFGVHVSTIERLVRRPRESGRVADRPRSGRPRVTSEHQDRAIRLAHLRNRNLTATETAVNTVGSHNRRIHPKTVMNRLREFGLRARRPKVTIIVVPGNLTAVRYRDEILRPVAVPLVQQHQMTFQHDNARPHVARVCQDFLANNNIVPLDWPPYSPDLSPIEHLWDELDRRVRRRRNTPNTLRQLQTALLEEWENIPMKKINALVNSMQRRIRAVINARGGHTRY